MPSAHNPKSRHRFKVRPITNPAKIREIRRDLKSNPRDLLLFDLIIQTGIELNYLLGLKVSDLLPLGVGDFLIISGLEGKTPDTLIMTRTLYSSWQRYLKAFQPSANDYLIRSRKGLGALHLSTASDLVRKWLESVNLFGLAGVRSLRKTWEHNQRGSRKKSQKNIRPPPKKVTVQPNIKQTVQGNVYNRLFYDIVSGRIPPGARLVSHTIAKQMNISQAPVREALRLLQAAGLVFPPQKKGSVVNELSRENLKEISELRITLEMMAVRNAVDHINKKILVKLEALQREYIEYVNNNNVEKALESNKLFHHTLYAAAKKPILLSIIGGLWDRMSPYLHLLFKAVSTYNLRGTIDNHQRIIDGLKVGNDKMVVGALENDLKIARDNILHFFKKID